MWLEIFILSLIPIMLGVGVMLQDEPEPLNGVYMLEGNWYFFKKAIFYIMLIMRKRKNEKEAKKAIEDKKEVGYGMDSRGSIEEMECPQKLEDDPYAIDAVYFNGMNKDGTYFVLRIGRRPNNEAEIWLTIKVPGIGVLQSPVHPDTKIYNTDGKSFSAGGLSFECLEPMRRWKVKFNGLLRQGLYNDWKQKDEGKLVHCQFSFTWEAYTESFSFDKDLDFGLLADAVAREKWTKEFWERLKSKHQTHYEQYGEMWGTFKVEGHEERIMYLKGTRDHSYGIRDWRSFHRYAVHFGILEDGTAFHVSMISLPLTTSYLQTGYVMTPCAKTNAVTSMDFHLPSMGENGTPPDNYTFNFTAGDKKYNLKVKTLTTPKYYHHDDWGVVIHEKLCIFESNGIQGYGVTEYLYRNSGGSPVPKSAPIQMLKEPEKLAPLDYEKLALTFDEVACGSSVLVGGKGCQLALLSQFETKDFIVPRGFCLTIGAFKLQLSKEAKLVEQIEILSLVACKKKDGDLKTICDKTVELFLNTPLVKEVDKEIDVQMKELFGESMESLHFAVRSSAAGEDSEEMSAAGQMETILGVKGLPQIKEAVRKCWASHFAFQAVEYRRQHGQTVRSCMGIVIQEMVHADMAGVLFTVDPLTGNPGKMSMNANYGLGESVVSGVSEPDTITFARSWSDEITILNRDIGSKKMQIKVKADGNTEETNVTEADAKQCCLSDEMVLKLGEIGIKLEKAFTNPRDIEWAIHKDKIYLLQARPITTTAADSEWDIMHEFDSPLATNYEMMTTANIGEMMPMAMTPLTLTTFYRAVEYAFQDIQKRVGVMENYVDLHKFLGSVCGHGFINVHFMQGMAEHNVAGNDKRMAELAVMGEVQEEITLDVIKQYWGGTKPYFQRVKNAIKQFRNMRNAYYRTEKWSKLMKDINYVDQANTAQELYDVISKNLPQYYEVWSDTIPMSGQSASWSSAIMAILCKGKPNWTTEHYSDVAMLLSKCDDVYSADVPTALQKLAEEISKSAEKEKFVSMTVEEATEWLLQGSSGEVGEHFKQFLEKHGHRCVREAEFYERSWKTQPYKVVKVLQALLKTGQVESKDKTGSQVEDVNTAIAQIKTPVTAIEKKILQFVLPRARRAVGYREWGKSISIEMVEKFKLAYWKLGNLMVKEGLLPDEDLVFFFSQREIGQVLKTRSGAMVAKAQKRKRLFPKQMALKFPRINIGHPKQIDETLGSDANSVVTGSMKGMPVSQGVVKGTARVVKSLDDASLIQRGDILIVPYTDVGWSPYFPLISGLVTEIGGLVSHGAVVAREYGIPCVVNLYTATSTFKSGDQVILNGSKGTLEKLES